MPKAVTDSFGSPLIYKFRSHPPQIGLCGVAFTTCGVACCAFISFLCLQVLGDGDTVCASRFYHFRLDCVCRLSPALCFPAVVVFQLVLKQPLLTTSLDAVVSLFFKTTFATFPVNFP